MNSGAAFLLARALTEEALSDPLNIDFVAIGMGSLGTILFSLVVSAVGTAVVTFATVEHLAGRHANFGDAVSKGVASAPRAMAVSLLAGLGTTLAMLALILPGIIVACGWWLAVPVTVIEGRGASDSLSRSWYLTQGSKGTIFGLFAILGLFAWGANALAGVFLGGEEMSYALLGAEIGVGAISMAVQTAAAACFYVRVRRGLDQIDIDSLAGVFR
ncbi:MAG: hypothetical protein AAGA56_02915 [Myxococcota bacterium]